MPQTVDQIVTSLSHSGVLSASEIQSAVDRLSEGGRLDAAHLAGELLRRNKLTPWQAAAVARGDLKGLALGDYVLLDRIGAGSMGQVFQARHRRMKRTVALKVLPTTASRAPDLIRRFQREVQAAAMLDHPNIVTAFDAGEAEGVHFLVMQYVDGGNLKSLVDAHGPLSVPQAVSCVLQAARGLDYAHRQGVVHRDVKPANLLLERTGTVKVLDLGLARIAEEACLAEEDESAGRLTLPNQMLGTADYMSPEQAADTHRADARSDVYSLGCTLYYLLNGAPVFSGDTMTAVLMAHAEAPVPRLCPPADDHAEILDEIFRLMVAKDPATRHQSMADLIFDLELLPSEPPAWPGTATSGPAVDSSTVAPRAALTQFSDTEATMAADRLFPPRREDAPG